jgi:hypothetical protein
VKKIIIALLVSLTCIANATLITSNTITSPTAINVSTQETVLGDSGPIQIGDLVAEDVTITGVSLYTNLDGWGLVNNGSWVAGMTYVSRTTKLTRDP